MKAWGSKKIIRREEAAELPALARWAPQDFRAPPVVAPEVPSPPPEVDATDVDVTSSGPHAPAASEPAIDPAAALAAEYEAARRAGFDAGQQAGYQEGFAAGEAAGRREGIRHGLEQGLAEGRAAAAAEQQQLTSVLAALTQEQAKLAEALAPSVRDLALAVARQMVKTLPHDGPTLLAMIQDALVQTIDWSSPIRLRLHPEDADLIAPLLEGAGLADCLLERDSQLARGDCKIEAAQALIDLTAEARWARIQAALGAKVPWEARE
jgi:flagellar assembly protein FliH